MRSFCFDSARKGLAASALIVLFSLPIAATAQANHEAVAPNPQRYQQRPSGQQSLPDFLHPATPAAAPAPDQEAGSEPTNDQAAAAPVQAAPVQRQVQESSLDMTSNDVMEFIHQHIVLSFLIILLIAPVWAMFSIRGHHDETR